MKYIFVILFFSVFLLSCDSDTEEIQKVNNIELSEDTLTFDYNGLGDLISVKVTSSQDWRLTGRQDWAVPSTDKGKSGESVTFKLEPNTGDNARIEVFTLFCGNVNSQLKIIQTPKGYVDYLWGKTDISMDSNGGIITSAIKSNMEFSYEISEGAADWIKLGNIASDTPEKWIQFSVDPNDGFADRTAKISLFKGEAKSTLTIAQEKRKDIIIQEKELWEFGLEAAEIIVKVRANVDYTTTIDSKSTNWLTLVSISEPVDTEVAGLQERSLKFSFSAVDASRLATITLSGDGITKIFKIRQSHPNPTLINIPDQKFREYLNDQGYIIPKGDLAELTYNGLKATSLDISSYSYRSIVSLKGIDGFTNLISLKLEDISIVELDLSHNTKLTTLDFSELSELENLILGDINVQTLDIKNGYNSTPKRITVSSSKVKNLSLAYTGSYARWYDELQVIDISGCPALETADCRRNGKKLTDVYISQNQKTRMNNNQLTITLTSGVDPAIIKVK